MDGMKHKLTKQILAREYAFHMYLVRGGNINDYIPEGEEKFKDLSVYSDEDLLGSLYDFNIKHIIPLCDIYLIKDIKVGGSI